MKKKLLSLTAVAAVTIGVAAYAIGYEKFKINDASDYVSEYVLEFDANTNKPTNLDSTYKIGTYKAYTKDHNEITIEYEYASANPNGYINLEQGGSILNPFIEGGYGNNRISSILSLTANFTGELTLSLSAVNSTTYSIKNQSLTSGELYSVTNDDQYSYFKLDASTNCSITSIEIKYSCVYVDTAAFEFVKVDGGYELSNYNGDGGDVVIPDTYLGLPVISIGNSAFENCESLISVTIPSSVTTIGNSAFSICSSLTTVTIGENSQLTSIGDSAFSNCSSFTSITIPDSVTSIGIAAFFNCDSLTSITIPDSVTTIGDYAFSDCSSLTSIVIPDSVTTIGENAFSWCSNLTTVTFGENSQLTSIGDYAFYDCWSLISITIPDSVTSIGNFAFYNCSNLTTVTFGENSQLTSIADYAFYYCSSLTSITIPDSITTIGYSAFYYCSNLTTVTFGENSQLTSIADYAFYYCSSLTSIVIPNNVTTIGEGAFYNCDNLTIYCEAASQPSEWDSNWNPSNRPVVWDCLNAKTTDDGFVYHVYENEDETKYIVIDAYIGTATEVVIPNTINVDAEEIKVTTIGERAFYGDNTITSVTIGKNVTTIGISAFENCSNLTIYCEAASQPSGWSFSWNFSNRPVVWDCLNAKTTDDGFVYRVYGNEDGTKYIVIEAYIGTETEVIIPNTIVVDGEEIKVTTIGERVFYDDDTITSVTIGKNVTTIGNYAFCGCNNLTTVTFGENSQLTSIADYAFAGCFSLTSIIIPSSVTTIGSSAFENCDSLTSIIIPDSVTTIGRNAFYWCFNLTIYCEAASQPSGWDSNWNPSCLVVWGYTGE